MGPRDVQAVLAANLAALMAITPELDSQVKLAKKARLNQTTVSRILSCRNACSVANLQKLAAAFKVAPWTLLIPGFDPRDPPAETLSRSQVHAWQAVRIAAESIARYREADEPEGP